MRHRRTALSIAAAAATAACNSVSGVYDLRFRDGDESCESDAACAPPPECTPATCATTLAAGHSHTCALQEGRVRCWGENVDGELGDGTLMGSPVPVDVLGLPPDVVEISAGRRHCCAVTSSGALFCWGSNGNGQLGARGQPGVSAATAIEVAVSSSAVVRVAAGDEHTCAVTVAGALYCWGHNDYGQLGDGSTTSTPVPRLVVGSGAVAVGAGRNHTCVVSSGGGLSCWGNGGSGQLGDGSGGSSLIPVDVAGLAGGVANVATGRAYGDLTGSSHACAVMSSGELECWGSNGSGQLGTGTNENESVPTPVPAAGKVATASAGQDFTCVVSSSGGVACWGANDSGKLGDGSGESKNVPTAVMGLSSGAVAVAAGREHACALTSSGGVECWGANGSGQIGSSAADGSSVPVEVPGL